MNSQLPPRSFRYRLKAAWPLVVGIALFGSMLVGWVWTGLAGWR